jgi:hypothetical protein
MTAAVRWGIAVGAVTATLPAAIWWLDVATVHSMTIDFAREQPKRWRPLR